MDHGVEPKKRRLEAGPPELQLDVLHLLRQIPKDLGTPFGVPLNALLLRHLGTQCLATSCKAALDWSTLDGKRVVGCLNEEGRTIRGPFVQLERLATTYVEHLRLGRYGAGRSAQGSAELIVACCEARILRCVYAKLDGLAAQIEPMPVLPNLQLRRLRFHECRLGPTDLALVLHCSPHLENLDACGEPLDGLAGALERWPPACRGLHTIDFTDCGLQVSDGCKIFRRFSASLRSIHIQASDLRGIQSNALPCLEVLRLLDCNLERLDVIRILTRCPLLKTLALCGNDLGRPSDDLGEEAEDDEGVVSSPASTTPVSWPRSAVPQLIFADFRSCRLTGEDEMEIQESLPQAASIELDRAISELQSSGKGGRHIVFDDSTDDEAC